ncbi:uncharacterized protein LOC129739009 [Uranotaenia lowii]|uniref:uncharacterized protein LOC129739009 n=1 Tax=Uranotaenia lowii TaxID=190385 RepID=UPI00247A2D98|nr:uncharacterized protein LOC129739009 [Uranotaenia lowii]
MASAYEIRRADWLDRLDRASGVDAVQLICKDICNAVDRKFSDKDDELVEYSPGSPEWGTRFYLNYEILVRLKELMNSPKTTFAQQKIISKTLFRIYAHNYRSCRMVFPMSGIMPSGKAASVETVAIYGMVFSSFLTLPGLEDLTPVVSRNFELFQAMGCYARHFNTLSENLLTMQKMDRYSKFFNERLEKIWHIVLLNLESPYKGVRDCMISILKSVLLEDKFVRSTMLPAVLRWSWLNRNKFHVLLVLLGRYKLSTLEEYAGEEIGLYAMLEMSLHYKHLYSGSQGIVRVLQKQQDDNIFELQVRILKRGSIYLVRSMIKQWFSNLTPSDFRKLFQLMQLDQLKIGENRKLMPYYLKENNYIKFFQYMNLFKKEFQSCKDLNVLLVLMLQISTEVDLDHLSITLMVETLVHHIVTPNAHIHPSTSVFYIFKLKEYILQQVGVPSVHVCNTFVTQCTKLLHYIASLPVERYAANEDAYGLVSELMGSTLFYQHLHKQATSNYHAVITSLRFFQAFASLFLEFTPKSPYRLQEKATANTISHLLPMEADTFYDMIYAVEHLLTSEYEDVRAIALKMLYNKSFAFHHGPALQGKLSLIYSYRTPGAVLEAMTSFYDESHVALTISLRDHERDLFAMMKTDNQLYQQLDGINEAFFGYEESRNLNTLENIRAFPSMLRLVNRVIEFVLRSLNCAKTDEERQQVGSSFEIMDNSLQLLLDRSSQRSTNLASDKKTMMKALWKALRSAASFLENYALWLLDKYRLRLDVLPQLSLCMRAFVLIMINCCHRGAVEGTAFSFGKVIRRVAVLKEKLVVRNDHRNRQARLIVDMVEKVFRTVINLPLQGDEFRRCRGYLWMIHSYIKNDSHKNSERAYLKVYIEEHKLPLFNQTITPDSFLRISVLQLHQLNMMVHEASMNETMLEFIDDLMIIALERFKSPEWPVRNAALQLYSSIVTKLVGQRQQCSDPDNDWPPVYVSFNELLYKLIKSNKYILKELRTSDPVSTPFLILVLEFLSKVEYRAYHVPGQKSLLIDYRILLWRYLKHDNDQVRTLAGVCFAQLHDFYEEIPRMMENMIICLFTSRGNENFRHGICKAIHFMVRKYITNARYMSGGFNKPDYLASVREMICQYYLLDTDKMASYRMRCSLLDLLLYLGFEKMHPAVVELVFNKLAVNNYGLNVFLMRTNALYNGSVSGTTSSSMDYEVVIEGDEKDDDIIDDD